MFTSALDHCIRFIGVHPEGVGCTSGALGDFICYDVLPFCGWAPNATLCDAVVTLILRERPDDVAVCRCAANEPNMRLTSEEALALLAENSNRVQWTDDSTNSSTDDSLWILTFSPSPSLREEVLGVKLHTESRRGTSNYMSESAVHGVDNLLGPKGSQPLASDEDRKKYKPHTITNGLKWMRNMRLVTDCYLFDPSTKTLMCRTFPSYAAPLSEVEKPLFYVDANVGPLPTERAQQRCNYPLNHYFERRRRASATFPSVVFDLSLIRYVVKSSPDRKLLLPDAIHAVFASHNFTALDWSGMGKIDRSRYRRMLNSAGLSVVVAKVDFRGRLHAVRLVVPEEDLAAHLAQGEQSEEPAAAEGEEDGREEGDLKMEPDDDTPMTERKVIDTCEKLAIANRPLFVAPQYPLLLQAVREAEARPLALTSVYPDMLLYGEGMKPLLAYFGAYSKTRQTLKSSYMRAKNSRAFTLVYERKHGELEAPPKVSAKLDSPAPETSADKLPSGLSEYSVSLVLDALRSAPHQALTLNKLSTMVDLTLLRRKILPYLRSSNQVDTTGYSPKGKRRVGIITLNGVSLSESTMARIIESEAKEKELSPTMAKASHMVQTKLVLQRLPAMVEGSSRSTEVERLLVPGRRSQKLVSQLIMVRNGFSRNSLYRAGRLHLELWKQLFDGDQLRRRDVSWEDKATLTARHVLEHMSLSTFCIVIGLPTVDLGSVLKYDGQWGTPMCDQPPTVQAWCRSQGTHTLLHSLGELQERGLIKSSRRITAVMWTPLDEIDFVVSDHCQLDEETGILYAPHYTPSSTAYMCLLFWRPLWNAVSHTHAILRHVTSIYNVDSNISIPRMVALARLLRMDHSLLAEALYQSCGMRSRRNKDSTALEDGVRTHLPAMRDGRRRRTKIHRSEVSVATVFGKIQNIFRDGHPTRRLKDLLGFLGRTRRNALIAANLVGDSECESTAVYNRRVNRSVSHLGVLGELVNRLSSRRVPGGSATSATVDERSAAMATFAPDASSSRGQPTDIFAKEPDEERVKATEARVRRLTSLGERHEDVKLTSDRNEFEMVLDIMRMILLSDRAHYNATTAREVLLQFPSPLIRQARAYLQRQPAFCRGGSARSRIADLSLSAGPRFLVGSMSRDCLRPCANTSLLHQWIYTSDRAAVAQTTSPQHRLCIDGPLRTETEYEVVVTQRPPVLTDQLTGSKRVDERMLAGLRIPTLAWPSNAASLEKWSTAREERLRVAAQRRKRQREDDADGEGDEAADDEEEDDAVHVATTDGVALQLYPARSLTAHIDHYALLHNIPTDAPPTTAELHAVTRQTSKEVKAVPATRQGTLPLTAPIEYPSPFHHVDGAFHRYAWNSFLMAVYELVLQLPGISDTELTRRLLLSGLVSSRAVRAGIEALIHSGVLVRESVRSTLAPEASPYSMQASSARSSHSLEYAYKATIPLEGLWSTIETFC